MLLRTAELEGLGRSFKHMMDVTSVNICLARLSAIKQIEETFS